MSVSETGLTILWRGSLESCNYGCPYCPFAKTKDDRQALKADREALERFAAWVLSRPYNVSVLITPWGEALIRRYYRDEMARLSHAANVPTIAVQTNLSCRLDWLEECDLRSLALWTTFHPGETPRRIFIEKIEQLEALGVRYSVGVVGLKEHLNEIDALRHELPKDTYLWVNAYKRLPNYYSAGELERLIQIDPLFALNNRTYPSQGRACHAGETAISVLADGTARRCHFLKSPLGNIFEEGFEQALMPRLCPVESCRCHIGYSHLKALDLRTVFGSGFLERKPDRAVSPEDASRSIRQFEQGD